MASENDCRKCTRYMASATIQLKKRNKSKWASLCGPAHQKGKCDRSPPLKLKEPIVRKQTACTRHSHFKPTLKAFHLSTRFGAVFVTEKNKRTEINFV